MYLEELMLQLENAIKSALEWFCYNGMKHNGSKCKLLVCGYKFESMVSKVEDALVIETHLPKIVFEIMCKKASQKLNTLSRLCAIIPFGKRKVLMQAFCISQCRNLNQLNIYTV